VNNVLALGRDVRLRQKSEVKINPESDGVSVRSVLSGWLQRIRREEQIDQCRAPKIDKTQTVAPRSRSMSKLRIERRSPLNQRLFFLTPLSAAPPAITLRRPYSVIERLDLCIAIVMVNLYSFPPPLSTSGIANPRHPTPYLSGYERRPVQPARNNSLKKSQRFLPFPIDLARTAHLIFLASSTSDTKGCNDTRGRDGEVV
jgi:hypothetical protein